MELERFKRKPVYYSTVGMVIVWLLMLFYIALTKIDAEHNKALIEIEKVLQPWKEANAIIDKDEQIKFRPQMGDSLSEKLVEIYKKKRKEIFESIVTQDEITYEHTSNESPLLEAKKKGLLRDWLNKDAEDDRLPNPKIRSDETLSVSENILQKFRTRQQTVETNDDNESYKPRAISLLSKLRNVNTSLKYKHLTNNHTFNDAKTFARADESEQSIAALPSSTNTGQTKDDIHVFTANSEKPPAIGRNFSKSKKNKMLNGLSNEKTDSFVSTNMLGSKNVLGAEADNSNIRDSLQFQLSENETTILTNLPNTRGRYIDTTSDQNVKNEIGPISHYVDQVYTNDIREKARSRRVRLYNDFVETRPPITDKEIAKSRRSNNSSSSNMRNSRSKETTSSTSANGNVGTIKLKNGRNLSINRSAVIEHKLLESRLAKIIFNQSDAVANVYNEAHTMLADSPTTVGKDMSLLIAKHSVSKAENKTSESHPTGDTTRLPVNVSAIITAVITQADSEKQSEKQEVTNISDS